MGEKNNRLARALMKQPNCVYCGGSAPGTSVDYCPPIAIFDLNWRPRGLEFTACHDCHEGTRKMDAIVAMLSRLLAPPGKEPPKAETEKYIKGFLHNHPDMAAMFDTRSSYMPTDFEGREVHAIPVTDPARLANIVEAFGARLGLAMFSEAFGCPASKTASVRCRWYSNVQMFEGDYPEEFLQAIGLPRTLVMGEKSVTDQFRYWAAIGNANPAVFGCFSVFRESFGVLSIVREDIVDDEDGVFHPGFLQGFRP